MIVLFKLYTDEKNSGTIKSFADNILGDYYMLSNWHREGGILKNEMVIEYHALCSAMQVIWFEFYTACSKELDNIMQVYLEVDCEISRAGESRKADCS